MHAVDMGMAVVRRTKDGIDILEHAMQGVRSSGNREKIHSFHTGIGIVGVRSGSVVYSAEDTPVEREVIVRLPNRRKSR
jgi:hypothetical protein